MKKKKLLKEDITTAASPSYLPQLNQPFTKIVDGLKDENVEWRPVIVRVGQLKPLQKNVTVDKMKSISSDMLDNGKEMDPIFISNDDHILDGHHRAAGLINAKGKDEKIKCIRIDLDKDNGVRMLNKVSDKLEFEEQHKQKEDKSQQVENKNVLRFNKKQLEEYAKQVIEQNLEEYDLNEIKSAKKSYFKNPNPHILKRAENYGLIDIENHHLTPEGLIAKMIKWDEGGGGVEAYIYDTTKKQLEQQGYKMPDEIRRISDDENVSPIKPAFHGGYHTDFPGYGLNEYSDENSNINKNKSKIRFSVDKRAKLISGEGQILEIGILNKDPENNNYSIGSTYFNIGEIDYINVAQDETQQSIIYLSKQNKALDENIDENELEEGPRTHSELRRQKIKSYPEKKYAKSRMRPYERKKYNDISENEIDRENKNYTVLALNKRTGEKETLIEPSTKEDAEAFLNDFKTIGMGRYTDFEVVPFTYYSAVMQKHPGFGSEHSYSLNEKDISEDKINKYLKLKEKYNIKGYPSEELSLEEQDKFMEELINIKENIPNNNKKIVKLSEAQFTEMIKNIQKEYQFNQSYAQAGLPVAGELPAME